MREEGDRSRLREARDRLGVSQGELARRAQVSRARVGAIEQGRHVPGVDAALRLAAAVGETVESLFGEASPAAMVAVFGESLGQGTLVRATRVGERLVVAALSAGRDPVGWGSADGIINAGQLTVLAEGAIAGALVLGCDPALRVADELSASRGAARVVGVSATTGQALAALSEGRCHGALVHGRMGHLPAAPVAVGRWHVARWRVGIGVHPKLGHPSLDALLEGGPQLVRRDASAASDQAVVRAARRRGLRAPQRGPLVASGHMDAALRASWMEGAAVTFEPAAGMYGLDFEPLETHVVELWVAEPWREHPGITTLLSLLESRAFRDRVEAHTGYDLQDSGVRAA